jgi:hypothetical protein
MACYKPECVEAREAAAEKYKEKMEARAAQNIIDNAALSEQERILLQNKEYGRGIIVSSKNRRGILLR